MNSIEEQRLLFSQILDLLEHHFGPQCEIVLHDNTKVTRIRSLIPQRSDQRKERLRRRRAWGLEVLSSEQTDTHRYNKVMVTDDGRIIRNSSIFFQDSEGKNIGSLCLNTDITPLVEAQKNLDAFTLLPQEEKKIGEEPFTNDVNQILELLLQECRKRMDKPAKEMNKEEKMEIVRFLESQGRLPDHQERR